MNINDLVALTKAGFTKADIEAMGLINNSQPEAEVKEDEQKQEAAQDENKPEIHADDDKIKAIETKLDYVINRFNYMAVKDSQQPQKKEETIEDILSTMVR